MSDGKVSTITFTLSRNEAVAERVNHDFRPVVAVWFASHSGPIVNRYSPSESVNDEPGRIGRGNDATTDVGAADDAARSALTPLSLRRR